MSAALVRLIDAPRRDAPGGRSRMLWIVLLAVTVRLGVMVYFHSYDIPPDRDHWAFGYETGRIARSLALGLGYSSPLPEPTGPTGAMPPIYPFLISVLFRIFGIYTTAAACSVYLLQVLFSALTCVLISHLGCRIYSARIGSLAALLFALYLPQFGTQSAQSGTHPC